jgi:plastocyanin
MKPILFLATLVVVGLLVGCGAEMEEPQEQEVPDSSDTTPEPSSPSEPGTPPAVETEESDEMSEPEVVPLAADTIEVTLAAFNPASVKVSVGQPLKFLNKDGGKHNVYYRDSTGKTFQTGLFYDGRDAKLNFESAGTYELKDTYSKAMLTVKAE